MDRMRLLSILAVTGLLLTGCGDDEAESPGVSDGAGSTGADGFRSACDAVENLGVAILGIEEGTDAGAVGAALQAGYDEVVAAAEASGDRQLIEQTETAAEAFAAYLDAENEIDGREAANEADIALDRAAARCLELGATNEFPEEPAS